MNSIDETLRKAELAIESGLSRETFKLLNPLLKMQVPHAFYLASCIGKERESYKAFEARSFWLLHQAARLGHAHSNYLLGVRYEIGDGVPKSSVVSSVFFERAASLGHSRSKLSFGLDLVYGSNRVPIDIARGLDYIRQAAEEGVEDADQVLLDLESKYKDGD